MPLESKQCVVLDHAMAVIDDADQLPATALDFDPDPGCPGIERVLEQLFHHRSRALYDLAGRNLVCHLVGEYANAAHQPIVV